MILYLPLLLVGTTLILSTQIVTTLIADNGIMLDGIIHWRLPPVSGSLFIGGRLMVGMGVMSYRPNRIYYKFAVIVR